MSLISWLRAGQKKSFKESSFPGLPDPNNCVEDGDGHSCEAANSEVHAVGREKSRTRRKRGPYSRYTSKQRLEMARYAASHGLSAAERHFTQLLGKHVSYT